MKIYGIKCTEKFGRGHEDEEIGVPSDEEMTAFIINAYRDMLRHKYSDMFHESVDQVYDEFGFDVQDIMCAVNSGLSF